MKDCVTVARPSSRVVSRIDPAVAERLAARPAEGVGAGVGVVRRVPTAMIVCAALGVAGVSAPPIMEALGAPKAPEAVTNHGVTHVTVLPGPEAPVPAPGGALIFVPAVLALAWLRRATRGARAISRGAAGDPPRVSSLKLAGRGASRRARRSFGRVAWFLGLVLGLVVALPVAGHEGHLTPAENAWLDRQYARDGMKCCDRRDVHIGRNVAWRLTPRGYEVEIGGAWHAVPDGRLMRLRPEDPSPFGGQALLFYSPTPGGRPNIWCFAPEPLT